MKTENLRMNITKRKSRRLCRQDFRFGRSGGIRTHGLLDPNQARYQTSPHPETSLYYKGQIGSCQAFFHIFLLGLLKIEQLLELLIQSDTENQGELCSGVELSGFDGADCVSRNADQGCKLRLRELFLVSGLPQSVFEFQIPFHGYDHTFPLRGRHKKA